MARIDWKSAQIVELGEAVMLACGDEPSGEELYDDDLPSRASANAHELARIARRAVGVEFPAVGWNAAYPLRIRVELREFAAWVRKLPGASPKSGNKTTTSKAAKDCKDWLRERVEAGPQGRKTKAEYCREAMETFGVAQHWFNDTWGEITKDKPGWGKAGRRPREES